MGELFEALRLERLKRRLTQFQLSQLTGIRPSRISMFENGIVQLRNSEIDKLCEALKVKRDKLTSREEK
jgi:transcriptional regulator with XRE-family HTH domain